MSKTASKPLPSKRTPGKSTSSALRRAVAGRRDTAATAEEPHDRPVEAEGADLAGRRPGRLGGPGRRGIGRRGGRCRGRANRRRRPDRRSDPHLLDADGRNSHAQPRAGDGPGPAHPVQPQVFPPRHAGDGLHVAGGGGPAGEHSRRPRAAGSHHRGLGDQPPREAAAVEAAASQRAHAEQHHAPQPRGLPDCRPQGQQPQAAPSGLEAVGVPAGPGRAAGGRTRLADRALAARPGPPEAGLPADGGHPRPDGRVGPRRRSGRPAQGTPRGTLQPHADHAGEPCHPPPPHHPHRRPRRRVRKRQAEPLRRQLAAGRLHRQALPQPRPELPGPHPGGEHGTDAGGGQVRVRPRLQVLHLRHLVDPPGHYPRHRRPEPHHPRPRPHDRDHEPRPRRPPRAVAGKRRRAHHGTDRRSGGNVHRGSHLRHADEPPAPLAWTSRSATTTTATSANSSKITARTIPCWR